MFKLGLQCAALCKINGYNMNDCSDDLSPFSRGQDIYIIYSRVNLYEPITSTYPEEDSR